tara:strand:+ start:207 stop:446 length:240 start_codon:yes stop_codon:yes gene_type:complete
MLNKIVYYCTFINWLVLGGKEPESSSIEDIPIKKKYSNWSKAEYQMHLRNATSNLGMLNEAKELWNERPLEYHKKKEEE